MVTLATLAESPSPWRHVHIANKATTYDNEKSDNAPSSSPRTCNDLLGECNKRENERLIKESKRLRRLLQAKTRYISYEALKKDNVPCGKRGNSYYNCRSNTKANPYRRSCTAISGCKRFTD
ncbi:hypothetical protein ACFE04_017340 [Oxalis oulophora]